MRLLLLLSTLAVAHSIEVSLYGNVYFEDKYIQLDSDLTHTSGREEQTLTDNNQRAFGIRDEALKSAIETTHGKKPDNIYLTEDSPWGDLYEKYGWSPVKVVIEGGTPELTDMSSEKAVLFKRIYENANSETEETKVAEPLTKDTATSLWDMKGKNISAKYAAITLDFTTESIERHEGQRLSLARLCHAFDFGSNNIFVPTDTGNTTVSFTSHPGDKVLVQFSVKKATLRFKIPYKASVTGTVAAHYREKYRGHYFFGLPIDQVIEEPEITVDQWLTYEFYYDKMSYIINTTNTDALKKLESESVPADSTSSGRQPTGATDAAKNGKKIMMIHSMKMPSELSAEELKLKATIKMEVADRQLDGEATSPQNG